MPQIQRHQLENNTLTGASFDRGLKFYDETETLTVGETRLWNGTEYIVTSAVTGGIEGDLSNSPDLSSDWDEVKAAVYSARPSTSQTFTNARVTVNLDTERRPNTEFTLSSGEITFNKDNEYIVSVTSSIKTNSGTSRSGSNTFLQIDTGTGFADVPSFMISGYHRTSGAAEDTGSLTIPLTVSVGDKLRIQVIRYTGSDTMVTIPDGMNITIFNSKGSKGLRGSKGDPGADGDMTWEGVWSATFNGGSGYDTNMVVQYQGSAFVCIASGNTNNPGTPASPNIGWELHAEKGADGAGATITVQDNGSNVPNTPHGTLNFTGDITVTDAGSGVVDIGMTIPKNIYMVPIFGEENAALAANSFEWSMGNGGTRQGLVIYVPSGYSCEIVAMTLRLNAGTATVETYLNGVVSNATVTVSSGQSATNDSFTPATVSNGDHLQFRTLSASGTSNSNVVSAWLKYTES